MADLPEIRINLAWLLLYGESQKLADDQELESYEQFEEWTVNYRKEWRKHEKKILTALQDSLGIKFYKKVVDVSCAPNFVPKSDPLIIGFRAYPDEFVDVLTHELIHVLLTDNNKVRLRDDNPRVDLEKEWHSLFGENHDFDTLVHIPVHAVLKYIYLDVLEDPSRLERDIKSSDNYAKSYQNAWEYVSTNDYMEIINTLKKSYQELK